MRQSHLAPVVLSPAVFGTIADAETPPGIAAEIPLPDMQRPGPSVFLEGVQDAGNVGAIIRSAAAFGAGTLLVDRQCADPWSPKVLRAGMGGHFAIGIRQVEDLGAAIAEFGGRVICTVVSGVGAVLTAGAGLFLLVWWGNDLRRSRRTRNGRARRQGRIAAKAAARALGDAERVAAKTG